MVSVQADLVSMKAAELLRQAGYRAAFPRQLDHADGDDESNSEGMVCTARQRRP